ncbi:MAG: RHS repeat-associated core domain-containing protein [Luteolibacter sp.]
MVLLHTAASAQKLSEVLQSLDDRAIVAYQQSSRVLAKMRDEKTGSSSYASMPAMQAIDWPEIGLKPEAEDVDALELDKKIKVLNSAISKFDQICVFYLNLKVGELSVENAKIGTLRMYVPADFPALPVATPENYNPVLFELAARIQKLRAVPWVYGARLFEKKYIIDKWEEKDENDHVVVKYGEGSATIEGFQPSELLSGALDSSSGSWSFRELTAGQKAYPSTSEYVWISNPIYSKSNDLRRVGASVVTRFAKEARLLATVEDPAAVPGMVYLCARVYWTQATDLDAPQWNLGDCGFSVLGKSSDTTLTLSSGGPEFKINGTWTGGDESRHFVPTGVPDSWAADASSTIQASSPYLAQRGLVSLFVPQFTRGIDTAVMLNAVAKTERALDQPTHGQEDPELQPETSLLMGIRLGPGIDGRGSAVLGFPDLTPLSPAAWAEVGFLGGLPVVPEWLPVRLRSDYVSSLRLTGDASSYHVVYETSRSARGSTLPSAGENLPVKYDFTDSYAFVSGLTHFVDRTSLMTMWDLPRIKQVVSRDFIINVTSEGHYKQTLKIYRRNGPGTSSFTPGEILETTDATLVKTLVFKNPNAVVAGVENPYPGYPQQIVVTDDVRVRQLEASVHPEKVDGEASTGGDPGSGTGTHQDILQTVTFLIKGRNATTAAYSNELFRQEIKSRFIPTWQYINSYDSKAAKVRVTTTIDGKTSETWDGKNWNWFGSEPCEDWTSVQGGRTLVCTPHGSPIRKGSGGYTLTDSTASEPTNVEWNDAGLVTSIKRGDWGSKGELADHKWKVVSNFKEQELGTQWTEMLDGGYRVRTYSAPDGTTTSASSSAVDWSETVYGNIALSPDDFPGMAKSSRSKSGMGTLISRGTAAEGGLSLQIDSGWISGTAVRNGSRSVSKTNDMGYVISSEACLIQGGTVLKTAGSEVPTAGAENALTVWKRPLKAKDYTTSRITEATFDSLQQRVTSVKNGSGVTTEFSGLDALGRLVSYKWAGMSGSVAYNPGENFGVSSSLEIPGRPVSSASSWDASGRLLSSTATAGVTTDLSLSYTKEKVTSTVTDDLTNKSSSSEVRAKDGTLVKTDGDLLPFGGSKGDVLAVDKGLLKSKERCSDQPSAFSTVWTDAWGRPRKMEQPAPAGGTLTTTWVYSDPGEAVARVEVQESSGRRFVSETDLSGSSGIISRSGLDVDRNGRLEAGDRYRETTTTIADGKVETTVAVTEGSVGKRQAGKITFNPVTGESQSTLNGNEETVTSTPDFAAQKVVTGSSKGWTKTTEFNELGQIQKSSISGGGVATAEVTPDLRADGSLAGLAMNVGGTSAGATFGDKGLLTGATLNGRNLSPSHSISGGNETLTLDGVTLQAKLDGTQWSITGDGVTPEAHAVAPSGRGFADTIISPGAPTVVQYNAAGTKVAHNYVTGANTRYGWYPGGMLASISCARGGAVGFSYSNDGACDLIGKTFPAAASGPAFSYPATSEIYGRDSSGRINSTVDASGARTFATLNGHPYLTTYTAGEMGGYEVRENVDGNGRRTAVQVVRNGDILHTVMYGMNGASGEIASVNLTDLTVGVGRDANRLVTGFQWNEGQIQSWERDATGRITRAASTITGAPTFDYEAYSPQGRRLGCTTADGTWAYVYDGSGQLISAIHPTYGSFLYGFDGIGRRVSYDVGGHHYTAANGSDPLNRFMQVDRPQSKKLRIGVASGGDVWVNGVAQTVTDGQAQFTLNSPGTAGGWVNWNVRGALPGAGEAGANPDAVAEQSGHVWFPPASETFVHDAAGNRQSSARWDYGWDSRNRLRNARTKDIQTAPEGWEIGFDYDSEGRRFKKTVKRYEKGVLKEDTVTWFVWDGWELLYERQESATGGLLRQRCYGWGPDLGGSPGAAGGAGGLVVMRETSGETTTDYYPLYDGGGNVTGLAKADGSLAATYTYGPFGEPISSAGPQAGSNPMRWATKYYDVETGLYYFGQRYYDPGTGTWLSREPLGESESLNLYAYCHNDPINRIDVLGLEEAWIDSDEGLPGLVNDLLTCLNALVPSSGNSEEAQLRAFATKPAGPTSQELGERRLRLLLLLEKLNSPAFRSSITPSVKRQILVENGYLDPVQTRTAMIPLPDHVKFVPPPVPYNPPPGRDETLTLGAPPGLLTPALAQINTPFLIPGEAAPYAFARTTSLIRAARVTVASEPVIAANLPEFSAWQDFRVTAQAIQDAVKAEYGGVEAFNMAANSGPGQFGRVVESMSDRSAIYQSRVTGRLPDVGYTANGVKFDGFDTARGVLLDAKGPGYATFVRDGQFMPWYNGADSMVAQAQRQLGAAGGVPIEWHFAEEAAANATRNLFQSRGIEGISIFHTP